jgi:hypothetical protein
MIETIFIKVLGIVTVVVTYLYATDVIKLPHPEWSNKTLRIALPMVIGLFLVVADTEVLHELFVELVKNLIGDL